MSAPRLTRPDPADEITLTLPWPPSVNAYWRMFQNRMIISKDGREYRQEVLANVPIAARRKLTGRLTVTITAWPPDRRRRDIDNLPKCVLDALAKAGVYEDDSQIDYLAIERGDVCEKGRLDIMVREVAL